jgi:hypothetical protein
MGQVNDHPAAATAGIVQVQGVNPGHDPQYRFTHRHRPVVVERLSGNAQQHALPSDAELRVVVIDQLAQFMGVRAAEFFEPLQLHLQAADLLEQLCLFGLTSSLYMILLTLVNSSLEPPISSRFHWLTCMGWMAFSSAISWIVWRPLIASMAPLAWNSGLLVLRLPIGGSPIQARYRASEVNDETGPENPNTTQSTRESLSTQCLAEQATRWLRLGVLRLKSQKVICHSAPQPR